MYGGYSKKWVAKKKDSEEVKDEGPTGPCYAKPTMLSFFEVLHNAGIPDDFKLGYKTEQRAEGIEDDGHQDTEEQKTAKREALREVLKEQKLAKSKAKAKAAPKQKASAQSGQQQKMPAAPTPAMMWGMPPPQMWVPPMPYLCPLWGTKATMKLTNVPPSYKQETLAALLVWRFRGALDFLFLPEAPEGSAAGVHNAGHAFFNFRVQQGAQDFMTAFNNVATSTCFPGCGDEEGKTCKVSKVKIQTLDNDLEAARQRARKTPTRLPILLDMFGNARPIPTSDLTAAAAAASAAAAAAAMSAQAISGNNATSALRQQIEYYFSFDNMCRDVWLRGQMDEDGWVPMSLIASFNKVKQFAVPAEKIGDYLIGSEVVEVDNEKHSLRQKDPQQRVLWELRGAVEPADSGKAGSSVAKPEEASETPKDSKE